MKWTYGIELLQDDYFGELIIMVRTAPDGSRQSTPGNQATYDRVRTADDTVILVEKPNRQVIIDAWKEAAANWQTNPPHRRVEWYAI